jgi:hypothetical protein
VEAREFFSRAELLNLPQLRRSRPHWTDRLPLLPESPKSSAMHLVKRHWAFWVPTGIREIYMRWLASQCYRRNIEQIEIDELNEVSTTAIDDDRPEVIGPIYAKHEARRVAARFLVATRERPRLERLSRRWDVDSPKMIVLGEAREEAIIQVRRAIKDARWTFFERCAKVLIPVLSLLVALAALTLSLSRNH